MTTRKAWPDWREALPPDTAGLRRAEGGRRTRGDSVPRTEAPLVSYVTVVRNAASTLARTLQSVREQRWPHVEHIVVDGMSSDGTLEVILQHAGQIDYYVSEPDRGLYDALNKAIPLARGDLICVLNADDWLTRDAAQLAAEAHLRAGGAPARLVLSAAWALDGSRQQLWSAGRLDLGAYLSCANVCHNGVYATRAAYAASGPYATGLRIASDFRWLMACVDAGVATVVLDAPTIHYRCGGLSSDGRQHALECAAILRERFPFLDEAEAWGLLHAFHVFRHHLVSFAASRPPHLGRFLGEVAHAHSTQADFLQALALAGMGLLMHPEDDDAPARLTRAQKTRRSLHRRWMEFRAAWMR